MIRQEIKEEIKSKLELYLDKVTQKGRSNKYICPLCGSGTGNNNHFTPALSVNGVMWHCFSCNEGGEIFTLIAKQHNLDVHKNFVEIFNIAVTVLDIKGVDMQESNSAINMRSVPTVQEIDVKYKAYT